MFEKSMKYFIFYRYLNITIIIYINYNFHLLKIEDIFLLNHSSEIEFKIEKRNVRKKKMDEVFYILYFIVMLI